MASVEIPAPMHSTPGADTPQAATPAAAQVLVCVGASFAEPGAVESYERLLPLLEAIATRANTSVLLAHPQDPGVPEEKLSHDHVRSRVYTPASDSGTLWLQTASDYRTARDLMAEHRCTCCLMLGHDAQSINADLLLHLVEAVLAGADLAVPAYDTPVGEALVNHALIYPLSRAIFSAPVQMPLPIDLAMSARMCERLGSVSSKVSSAQQGVTLIWPVAEAAAAGFSITQIAGGIRPPVNTGEADLKTTLSLIMGSLFTDIEARAQFWQRSRPGIEVGSFGQSHVLQAEVPLERAEATQLIESFQLGYASLHEIWALVLPPNSLLGLKKLSLLPPEIFHMADALWVRVVYDFLLAHRLRTINRGHLLGALTPLYLAWVATYVLEVQNAADAEHRCEVLAEAFEADKPYLVSRWRWPDRFNP